MLVCVIIGDNNNKEEKYALGIENITTLDNINIKIGNDFYIRDEEEKLVV
ncbi:unknown [Clostridium sp. CAG:609]|nr:unknown [Clostridium sp. CAG:609]